jgi:hypothetical protein
MASQNSAKVPVSEARTRTVKLTDFERDVTIFVLQSALANTDRRLSSREEAAKRVIEKLREIDEQ